MPAKIFTKKQTWRILPSQSLDLHLKPRWFCPARIEAGKNKIPALFPIK